VSRKILVIDDEEELGQSLKKFLEQNGYEVTYLNEVNRDEVLHVENPDLIITDLLMPQIHGFDICKKVKTNPALKNIPLIAMTAVYKDSFHKMEAMRLGVEAFLEKPFKFRKLLERVKSLLGEDFSENEVSAEEPDVEKKPVKTAGEDIKKESSSPKKTVQPKTNIPSPASPAKPPSTVSNRSMAQPEAAVKAKKSEGKDLDHFPPAEQIDLSKFLAQIKEVEGLWEQLVYKGAQQNSKTLLTDLQKKVHSLAETASGSREPELGEHTGQLEVLIDMIVVEGEKTIPRRKNKINRLLDSLRYHPLVSTELAISGQEVKF